MRRTPKNPRNGFAFDPNKISAILNNRPYLHNNRLVFLWFSNSCINIRKKIPWFNAPLPIGIAMLGCFESPNGENHGTRKPRKLSLVIRSEQYNNSKNIFKKNIWHRKHKLFLLVHEARTFLKKNTSWRFLC